MREALLAIFLAMVIGGMSDSDFIFVNETELPIARIEIDNRKFDAGDSGLPPHNKVLLSVSPTVHHLKVVFRGGADVDWPRFNFAHVHEIFLERIKNKIEARVE